MTLVSGCDKAMAEVPPRAGEFRTQRPGDKGGEPRKESGGTCHPLGSPTQD